jgi:hypothetical protein
MSEIKWWVEVLRVVGDAGEEILRRAIYWFEVPPAV